MDKSTRTPSKRRTAPTKPSGPDILPPFPQLLQSLSVVYESQKEQIQALTSEINQLKANAACTSTEMVGLTDIRTDQPELVDEAAEAWDVQPKSSFLSEEAPDRAFSPKVRQNGHSLNRGRSQDMKSFMSTTSSTRKSTMIPDVWPVWSPDADRADSTVRIRDHSHTTHHALTSSSPSNHFSFEERTGEAMWVSSAMYQSFMMSPNSLKRLMWDLLSTLMVTYDLITIPLVVLSLEDGFFGEDSVASPRTFNWIMDWVMLTFWTTDMAWSFLTGYHTDGEIEMRACPVALHYIRGWFLFDFLLLVVEWGTIFLEQSRSSQFLGFMRIGKSARLLRIARTVRLLRFIKLHRAFSEFLDVIHSEAVRCAFNIGVTFAVIFAFSHYMACGWYLIGFLGNSGYLGNQGHIETWLEEKDGTPRYDDDTYAYFSALHWSLTQFTPASSEIHPRNLWERIYTIICLGFALVAFSSFLGSITAAITELRNRRKDASQQEYLLHNYLSRNHVSYRLSRTIWRFLRENHFRHQRRAGSTAALTTLSLLPPHLHTALYQELYGPYMTRCPFFYQYSAFWREGLVDVCTKGITESSLLRGESHFIEGRVAEKMYFVASGCVHYDHANPHFNQLCGIGAWISEAVLWVRWVHMATLYAQTTSEVIELDAAKFRSVMEVFKRSIVFVRAYANGFRNHLKDLGGHTLTDVMPDVRGLQRIVREAWEGVVMVNDRGLFREMKDLEFPHGDHRYGKALFHWKHSKSPKGFGFRHDNHPDQS